MLDELDEELFESQVEYEVGMAKMEIEDIANMECDAFEESLRRDFNVTNL